MYSETNYQYYTQLVPRVPSEWPWWCPNGPMYTLIPVRQYKPVIAALVVGH